MKRELANELLSVLKEYHELGIAEQIDYQKFYLYSIITHSTAIEGSTVTEIEAQLLFDEGITSSKRTMLEQMMNLDLKAAYEYGMQWIKRHNPITVESLIILASKVMAHTGSDYHTMGGDFSAAKGELRKLNVTAGIGGDSYMSYQKVPAKLAAFCEELNKRRKSIDVSDICAIYELSFWAHYGLVTIHPWADGNGRTCRLLMNLLQMEFDVLPTKVLKEDRTQYIQALKDARDEEDIELFVNCMAQLHVNHLRAEIKMYKKSQDFDPINTTFDPIKSFSDPITDRLYNEILSDNSLHYSEYAEKLGVSEATVKRRLGELKKNGVIVRVGSNKTGHWEIQRN